MMYSWSGLSLTPLLQVSLSMSVRSVPAVLPRLPPGSPVQSVSAPPWVRPLQVTGGALLWHVGVPLLKMSHKEKISLKPQLS